MDNSSSAPNPTFTTPRWRFNSSARASATCKPVAIACVRVAPEKSVCPVRYAIPRDMTVSAVERAPMSIARMGSSFPSVGVPKARAKETPSASSAVSSNPAILKIALYFAMISLGIANTNTRCGLMRVKSNDTEVIGSGIYCRALNCTACAISFSGIGGKSSTVENTAKDGKDATARVVFAPILFFKSSKYCPTSCSKILSPLACKAVLPRVR